MSGDQGKVRNRWIASRTARTLATAIVGALSVGLLVWLAPPGKVLDQIGRMNLAWVIVAIGLEVASCLSYVIVFRYFFPEPPGTSSRRVAWIAMGA